MKRSRMGTNRNIRRAEKIIATAALSAAVMGTFSPVQAATKTWTPTVVDTANSTNNTTPFSYFTANSNLYKWDTSATNWTSGGVATTYAPTDDVVFTDNVGAGTLIEVGSTWNPVSMTFTHVAGTSPANYSFLRGSDFVNQGGSNVGSSSPFGSGAAAKTLLTLDTGFLGTVSLRARVGGNGGAGANVIVKSGTLEIHDGLALPNATGNTKPDVTLAGGQLNIFVDTGGNIQPAGSNMVGFLHVTADSILSVQNGDTTKTPPAGNNWGGNGSITIDSNTTLSLESLANFYLNLSTTKWGGSGTIRLIDSPMFTTGAQFTSTSAATINFLYDTGSGHSDLANSVGTDSTFNVGALTGGVNTTLSGSNSAVTSTYSIGARGDNTQFDGTIRNGLAAGSTTVVTKVGGGILTLTGSNSYTGATNANSGTLVLAGQNGSVLSSSAAAAGGTLKLDNSANSNSDRLSDTLPISLNQGTLEFVGNLASHTDEHAGDLTIGGANTIKTTDFGASGSATITFNSLVRANGIVNFNLDPNTHVRLQTAPTLVGGIIGGFATTNSFQDWASLDVSNNVVALAAGSYNTDTNPANWGSSANVKVTTGSIDLGGSATANSLKFATIGGGNGLNIPSGSSLTVSGGGILANTNTTISGAGTLTAGDGSGPVELDLVVPDATQTLTINSVIADNGASGAVSLLKVGPGALVLGASNTFSGNLAIAGGTLSVGQDGLLSPTGGLTVDLGTTFELAGWNQSVATITLVNGQITNNSPTGAHGTAAAISVSNAIEVRNGLINANLSGSAALTKTSSGSVTLSGSNSYSGGTTMNGGTLNINSTNGLPALGSVTFAGGTTIIGANVTLGKVTITNANIGSTSSSVSITSNTDYDIPGTGNPVQGVVTAILGGNVGLNKDTNSNGSITLNAANTYTGATTITAGTLSTNSLKDGGVASGIGMSPSDAQYLVLDGATDHAYLMYTGSATSTNRLFTIGNGQNNIYIRGNNALTFSNTGAILHTGSGSLSLRGDGNGVGTFNPKLPSDLTLAKNDGDTWNLGQNNTIDKLIDGNGTLGIGTNTLTVNAASFTAGSLVGTGTLFINNDFQFAGGTISVVVGDGTNGALALSKQAGTGNLLAANTFTGPVFMNGGILNVATLADGGIASGIGKSSSADSNLQFTGQATLSYVGAVAASTDRQFQLNSNNAGFAANGTVNTATLTIGSSSFPLDNHSNTFVLGGGNTGSNTFASSMTNSGGLTKVDGGLWVLTGTSHTFSGNVTLSGGTLAVSSIENAGVNANITTTNGSNVAAIDSTTGLVVGQLVLNQNGATNDHLPAGTTVAAIGTGTITLSQNATQDGGSNASFAKANALGTSTDSSDHLDFGGGTLRYIGAGNASTDRQFTIDTGGGGIDASGGGTLAFTNTAMISNGGSGARTFRVSGSNTGLNTLAAGLGDGGGTLSVTKSGNGQWVLTGSNTYTGTTTVQTGTLNLLGASAWAPALSGTSASTTGGTVLTGGRLNFDYSTNVADNPATTIKNILTAGAPGNFQAGQIRTTTAPDNKHSIGWIDDSANKKVRVAYTYSGDANVDGVVNTGDFNTLAMHFNNANLATPGAPVWAEGDFNYDGKVNMLDFNGVATNFGAAAIAAPTLDAPSLGTLVPEPASLGLLGSIALLGVRRRRPGR